MNSTSGVAAQAPKNDKSLALFKAKWPGEVGDRGFAAVPKCLFTCMAELKLKPQEMVVLGIIIEKCWKAGEVAWPSVDYIATSLGRKKSFVISTTTKLAENGWITKTRRFNSSNIYSLIPAISKLNQHMEHCQHYAKKLEQHNQKSGGVSSQDSGDYIEANITKSTYIKPFNNSPGFTNEALDQTLDKEKYISSGYDKCLHKWNEFTQQRLLKSGEEVTYYYRNCELCGVTFHKKGDWPWPGEY